MRGRSENKPDWKSIREKVIGLGDESIRKSYYPELQERLSELQESETRFKAIFESVNDSIFVQDIETGEIIDVNQQMCELYGYIYEEVIHKNISIFSSGNTPYNEEYAMDKIKKAATGKPQVFEWQAKRKDGSLFWVEVSLRKAQIGKYERVVAVVRDVSRRKQTEEALRRSEEKYKYLIQNANSIIIRWNREGNITFINEFAQNFFGYSEEEIIGKNVIGTIVPETDTNGHDLISLIDRITNNPLQHGSNINQNMLKNGDIVWIAWTNKPIFDNNEQLTEILSVGVDITKQKLAEEAQQESEKLLSDIINFLPDATFAIDLEGKVIVWNKAVEKFTGVKAEGVVGKSEYEYSLPFYGERKPMLIGLLLHPDKQTEDKYPVFVRDGDSIVGEAYTTHLDPNGTYYWGKATYLYNTEGSIIGAIESVRDITDRKHAEIALRESENKFRSLVENTNDWVWEINKKLEYTYASPRVYDILGYTPEQICGKTPFDLMTTEEAKRISKILISYTTERKPFTLLENTLTHKDGHQIIIQTNGTPIFDDQGTFHGYRGIDRDVTKIRLSEERERRILAETEAAKNEFYKGTIFAVTDGKLNLVDYKEFKNQLLSDAQRIEMHNAEDLAFVRENTIKVAKKIGMSDDRIDMLVLAVGEAVGNAAKHANGGLVCIGAQGNKVYVSVQDNGPGMDTLLLPKATLLSGFSTKPSLGLGYSLILASVDTVYLATGSEGTSVLIIKEAKEHETDFGIDSLPDYWR